MNSDKDNNNNNGKITNSIGNSSTVDFGDKNDLNYSYKVPDQLQVGVYLLCFNPRIFA